MPLPLHTSAIRHSSAEPTHFPSVLTQYVVSLVDAEIGTPPLVEGVTHQPQVAWAAVVLTMGKHRDVQVAKVLKVAIFGKGLPQQ